MLPFQVELIVSAPPVASQPLEGVAPFPLLVASMYEHESAQRLVLTGSGSKTLDLGTLAPSGAQYRLLFVYQEPVDGGDVVVVTFNAASAGARSICPGGFLLEYLPTPQDTPAIVITHTVDAIVRVLALG